MTILAVVVAWFVVSPLVALAVAAFIRVGHGPRLSSTDAADAVGSVTAALAQERLRLEEPPRADQEDPRQPADAQACGDQRLVA